MIQDLRNIDRLLTELEVAMRGDMEIGQVEANALLKDIGEIIRPDGDQRQQHGAMARVGLAALMLLVDRVMQREGARRETALLLERNNIGSC